MSQAPEEVGMMDMFSSDVRMALEPLRAALERVQQRGQTQISFEELCSTCSAILGTSRPPATRTETDATAGSSKQATVLAASVVYWYLRYRYTWSMTRDRRDRLYNLAGMLDTLDRLKN